VPIAHQTFDAARRRIEDAQRANRWREIVIWVLLSLLFLTGLGMFVAGAVAGQVAVYLSGVALEGLIAWPIKLMVQLMNRRRDLATALALLPLVDDATAQQRLIQLIDILVQRV
jgi:hypothetical protein